MAKRNPIAANLRAPNNPFRKRITKSLKTYNRNRLKAQTRKENAR
jgi:hypothetical protein